MRGSNNLISVLLLFLFSLFVVSVKSKVIKCDKSLLSNAKIMELTENEIKKEPTTYKEFLETFREKSSSIFTMKIANENIREVCENSFQHVSGITVLNMTSNGINTLKLGCFFENTALQLLDLSDNELQEIKNGVFNDFQHLRHLVLSNNAIAEIGTRAFGNLPALHSIHLDHNNIVILGGDWFQHSPNLRLLDLSHNRITALGPRVFLTIRPTCHVQDTAANSPTPTPYRTDDSSQESSQDSSDDSSDESTKKSTSASKEDPAEDSFHCPPGETIDVRASGMNLNFSFNEIISFHPRAFEGLFYVNSLDLRNNFFALNPIKDREAYALHYLRNNARNLQKQDFILTNNKDLECRREC